MTILQELDELGEGVLAVGVVEVELVLVWQAGLVVGRIE